MNEKQTIDEILEDIIGYGDNEVDGSFLPDGEIAFDKKELVKVLKQKLQQSLDQQREEISKGVKECLECCTIHIELELDGSCKECNSALNANSMLYEVIKFINKLKNK